MRGLAHDAVGEQKRLAPSKTSNLRHTIHVGRVTARSAETIASADYAGFVEFGTRPHDDPRPEQERVALEGPRRFPFRQVRPTSGHPEGSRTWSPERRGPSPARTDQATGHRSLESGRVMATTTFRRDVTEKLAALAADFMNEQPDALLRVYKRRPTGFTPDLPAMYVGSEERGPSRTAKAAPADDAPQLVLVGNPTGAPEEMADGVDTLVDCFLDYITVHPHAVSSNTVTQVTTIRDVGFEVDDVIYPQPY